MIELLVFGLLKALFVGAVVAAVVYLTFSVIKTWFVENRPTLSDSETQAVAITLKKELENGNVVYIQGFFDENKEEMVTHRVIKPESVASDVEAAHRGGDVVVYQ